MSEMIERVAKAIWDSLEGDTHSSGGWEFGTGRMNVANEQKERFRKMARGAIEAMRHPTGPMVQVAIAKHGFLKEAFWADVFEEMVDAALADTPAAPAPRNVNDLLTDYLVENNELARKYPGVK